MSRVSGLFDQTIGLLQRTLNLRSVQNRVLAANVANADTPNYKAFEVLVEDQLRKSGPAPATGIQMARTHAAHLPPARPAFGPVKLSRSPEPELSLRADGNTVDLDRSMGQLAENAIKYKTSAQLISSKLKSLRNVIQGGRA
jgi:flagellar basal-body rod protein FlgB